MAERKKKKTEEKRIGYKGINIVLVGAGSILIVLLVGAVILMGSLLRQFTSGSGYGSKNITDEYKLGTLIIRDTPVENENLLPNTSGGLVQDISHTVMMASVTVRSYGENDNPYPDIVCFGVVIEDSGYILTSASIVRDESLIEAELYDGRRFRARLVGYDLKTDLCVLKIEGRNLRTASFGRGGMNEGESIIYIGLGQRGMMNISLGIAGSTEGGYLETKVGYSFLKLTITDRVASDVCHGGVVVNSHGQIVGFRCSIADDNHNTVYAVSITDVEGIIEKLMESGYVRDRYTLGICGETVSDIIAKARNLPRGVKITGLTYRLIDEEREILVGDILTQVGDISVESVEELEKLLSLQSEEVAVRIYRPSEKKIYDLNLFLIEDTGLYIH